MGYWVPTEGVPALYGKKYLEEAPQENDIQCTE